MHKELISPALQTSKIWIQKIGKEGLWEKAQCETLVQT